MKARSGSRSRLPSGQYKPVELLVRVEMLPRVFGSQMGLRASLYAITARQRSAATFQANLDALLGQAMIYGIDLPRFN